MDYIYTDDDNFQVPQFIEVPEEIIGLCQDCFLDAKQCGTLEELSAVVIVASVSCEGDCMNRR